MKKKAVLGIFALLYLFLCAEWGELSGEVPIRFFTTGTFFGYVFGGLPVSAFQGKLRLDLAAGAAAWADGLFGDPGVLNT